MINILPALSASALCDLVVSFHTARGCHRRSKPNHRAAFDPARLAAAAFLALAGWLLAPAPPRLPSPVAWYRLGEDDTGDKRPDFPAGSTRDYVGTKDITFPLTFALQPRNTATVAPVAAQSGSSLGLDFSGRVVTNRTPLLFTGRMAPRPPTPAGDGADIPPGLASRGKNRKKHTLDVRLSGDNSEVLS